MKTAHTFFFNFHKNKFFCFQHASVCIKGEAKINNKCIIVNYVFKLCYYASYIYIYYYYDKYYDLPSSVTYYV